MRLRGMMWYEHCHCTYLILSVSQIWFIIECDDSLISDLHRFENNWNSALERAGGSLILIGLSIDDPCLWQDSVMSETHESTGTKCIQHIAATVCHIKSFGPKLINITHHWPRANMVSAAKLFGNWVPKLNWSTIIINIHILKLDGRFVLL